ncbi:MAG: Coenzyme F420 hydrogenase/dehydrogenase, beta subunit C-terminal domain [Planctomycetota bacterium]
MQDTEAKLRQAVNDLLADDKVDLVVAYAQGSVPMRTRPHFVRSADDADKLVWNSYCTNNLAVYLPRLFEKPARPPADYKPPRIGLVAKGCDARSVVGLLKEHQVPRANVVIIAVPCPGMVDLHKVEAALDGSVIAGCREAPDGTLEVTAASGDETTFEKEDMLEQACLECTLPSAEQADIVIEGWGRGAPEERYEKIKEFEAKPAEERWRYFVDEISRCIRCYACRQACPNCYCKVCFADQTKPSWIGRGDDLSDVLLYHIGRIFHQAGRCVECDACVRACPMNIDLRLFTQKLVKDVQELFGYLPGLSVEELPPLCTFAQDDSESFITEPQES